METRNFTATQLLNSYGLIFIHRDAIGFMRRPQLEIHHGEAFPWVMATVGGMRDLTSDVSPHSGPNAEGFMGEPPTGMQVAIHHLGVKLGLTTDQGTQPWPWFEITHPFYYGEKTPDIRNVGSVFRHIRRVTDDQVTLMQTTLARRNATVNPKFVHELWFLTHSELITKVLGGNHSLKQGEVNFIQSIYVGLSSRTYDEITLRPLPEFT